MSDELIKFNEAFPKSKYREIYPQYTGPMETEDDRKKYQASKAPMNTKILSFDAIKDTKNRIGWIVPKDYIVIDIDNKNNARIVYDILTKENIVFSFMTGLHGGHFIFKNTRKVPSISAGLPCSLGIKVDVRCNEKGYIILPENDTCRKWGRIESNDLSDVPYFLAPLKDFKIQTDMVNMGDGDGRNDALLKHMMALIDYAKELTIAEKADSVRLINKYVFKTPIPDDELNKTVLRDDILSKDSQPKEEKRCFEERLAEKILSEKNIITCNDTCYLYNGKYYKMVKDIDEIERIIHLEYNANLKSQQRQEIIKFIKLKSFVPSTELNKNWQEMVFKNGVLNLNTKQLTPHTPDNYNTIYINYDYIEDAPYSPMIDNFMNTVSGADNDTKILLYEIIGACLLRRNVFSKFFILYGKGQTGKSSYLDLIKNLLGEENVSFLAINDLEEQFMPVNLYGKLANLGDDIPYFIKETANLKKLVTGQEFEAQRKFMSSIHFSNFATLIFTTNRLPEVTDRTSGFYRRFMIVEMNNKIEKPDPFFFDRLTDEDYEFLLSRAIGYVLDALKVKKLHENADSLIKLEEYRTEQSSVLMYLREFQYDVDKMNHKPCMEAYEEYKQYCMDAGFKVLKKVNFDREIQDELNLDKRNTTWKEDAVVNQCWRFVL